MYREIITACSETHTKHKYTVWAEYINQNVTPGGIYRMFHDSWTLMHFLGLCDQKISYKRVSDFGRLRS